MQHMTVVFSHGRDSGPWGVKIRALARIVENRGGLVISRDDTDIPDPDQRVARLVREARSLDGPVVLVGSSMGGYVATVASADVRPVGLFLMAPAFGMPGYAVQEPQPQARELAIVHGWDDNVVPGSAVIDFARTHRAMLHLVPAGHALVEEVGWLSQVFGLFLDRCQTPESISPAGRLTAAL